MTTPYLGHAMVPANTDLDLLAQTAANANATATTSLGLATTAAAQSTLALATIPSPPLNRTITTLQQWVNAVGLGDLNAAEYGVVGDGTADDTVALQKALTDGATYNRVVNCGNLVIKITAAVTGAGPGIRFDAVPHGDSGGPGILVAGTGYTALTWTGIPVVMALTIRGTGNAANGIVIGASGSTAFLLGQVGKIRVYNLAGFGCQIIRAYDSCLFDVSVELCNPAGAGIYSFSVQAGADTTNECQFGHIQVEKCGLTNGCVIDIATSTQQCNFPLIHSEQATAVGGIVTWHLGGTRSTYSTVRLNGLNPASATLKIDGTQSTYTNLLIEGAIDVTVDGGSSVNTFINPEIQGTFHQTNGQTGGIVVFGGKIASVYDPTLTTGTTAGGPMKFFGTRLTSLTLGFQTNYDPSLILCDNCIIDTWANSTSTHACATFRGCIIKEGNNLGSLTSWGGRIIFDNCDITCSGTVALSSGNATRTNALTQFLNGTVLHAALTYTNVPNVDIVASRITGTVACGDAGNHGFLCDSQSTVGASSSGISGVPTAANFQRGDTHWNPLPTAAATPGWRCTTAGGTFKAMAVLAA